MSSQSRPMRSSSCWRKSNETKTLPSAVPREKSWMLTKTSQGDTGRTRAGIVLGATRFAATSFPSLVEARPLLLLDHLAGHRHILPQEPFLEEGPHAGVYLGAADAVAAAV